MEASTAIRHASTEIVDTLSAAAIGGATSTSEVLARLLRVVRTYFGMEAAFVARFEKGRRWFEMVDTAAGTFELPVGASNPLEESYCQRVVDGRLPELICDAQTLPAALELAVTRTFPVGAHLSIPLRLGDGTVYGTFCCMSRTPDYTLNGRDHGLMRAFADIAVALIEREHCVAVTDELCRQRIEEVLGGEGLLMVYQPIVDLERSQIVGFESLARFSALPLRTPDLWFHEASRVGLGLELEAHAITCALSHGSLGRDTYIACNVSPDAVLGGYLPAAFCDADLSQVVLEITEHACVSDYERLSSVLLPLRECGMRLSVDDAGAGYSSLRHILCLRPDYIKLDMSLTRDIDSDRSKRALAAALIGFASETGCELIAEGVETEAELATLRELGVRKGQGYLLGRPASPQALQLR